MGETEKSARQLMDETYETDVKNRPLIDLHDGVGELPQDSIQTRELIVDLTEANGEVVIHLDRNDKKEERWIRYIPSRDIYELKTRKKRSGEEDEHLVRNPGEASMWLIKGADLTLMRPDSVLVEFGDPTRRIIPESPPEEIQQEPRPDPPNHEYDTSYDLSN